MDRLILHALVLGWASFAVAGRTTRLLSERVLLAAVAAGFNLAVSSVLLVAIQPAAVADWFLGLSLGLAAGVAALAERSSTVPELPAPPAPADRIPLWLGVVFTLTVAAMLITSLVAARYSAPYPPEALTYQLPSSLSDLASGSDAWQPPFDHGLIHTYLSFYGAPFPWLHPLNAAAWIVAGIAAYRLCRLADVRPTTALASTGLITIAAPVVAQSASTAAQLPAAAALLCGAVFAVRARQSQPTHGSKPWVFASGFALLLAVSSIALHPSGAPSSDASFADFFANFLPFSGSGAARCIDGTRVGFGPLGAILFVAALSSAIRSFRCMTLVGICAWLGFAWLGLLIAVKPSFLAQPQGWLPAMFAWSVCFGAGLDALLRWRRLPPLFAVAGLLVLTGWSTVAYLLDNPRHPLRPLATATFLPPPPTGLPPGLVRAISHYEWVNLDTDGTAEAFGPLQVITPRQRLTAGSPPNPNAYQLISRSALARNAALSDSPLGQSYVAIAFPKTSAGVKTLTTAGPPGAVRDYFGLIPLAGDTTASANNQLVLVTASRVPSDAESSRVEFKVTGLNQSDQALLTLEEKSPAGDTTVLAYFQEDGAQVVSLSDLAAPVVARITAMVTGTTHEAVFSGSARPHETRTPLFAADVVRADHPLISVSPGLHAAEGPFGSGAWPRIRWAMRPAIQLELTATPELTHARLSFSLRLYRRAHAEVEVLLNGTPLKKYPLSADGPWLDESLSLTLQPGPNQIEFRDTVGESEPEWEEYLERYPDVKSFLLATNTPLAVGAREHYEASGRAEGRIMRWRPVPPPERSAYFMFRQLQVEGFNSP